MTIAKELGYKRYFNVQEILLKIIGVDFKKQNVKYSFLLIVLPFLLGVMMFSYAWKNRFNSGDVTQTLGSAVQMLIAGFKLLFFVINQKKIQKLIQAMWAMSKNDDAEEHKIIIDLNTKAYYITNVLVIVAGVGQIALVFSRPLVMTIIYLKTGIVPIVPILIDVIIDYSEPWKYAIVHSIVYMCITIVATGVITINILYIWLVLNLVAQFRILNLRVRRTVLIENVNEMDSAIIECIRFHQRIIEFAENFDLVYSPMIFVQFALTCLPLGFSGYQLTVGSTEKNLSIFGAHLAGVSFEAGMYCLLGQQIQDESYNVSDNIYETFSWENLSKTSKQILLITMCRAQKCCVMTGIFFVVDLKLFVWVYRTTTSYITILWTLAP